MDYLWDIRHFVLEIRPETNEVVIGTNEECHVIYCACQPFEFYVQFLIWKGRMHVFAKIRYNHKGAWCTIKKTSEDEVLCTFDEPQRAITPGQAVVFYDGRICNWRRYDYRSVTDASRFSYAHRVFNRRPLFIRKKWFWESIKKGLTTVCITDHMDKDYDQRGKTICLLSGRIFFNIKEIAGRVSSKDRCPYWS